MLFWECTDSILSIGTDTAPRNTESVSDQAHFTARDMTDIKKKTLLRTHAVWWNVCVTWPKKLSSNWFITSDVRILNTLNGFRNENFKAVHLTLLCHFNLVQLTDCLLGGAHVFIIWFEANVHTRIEISENLDFVRTCGWFPWGLLLFYVYIWWLRKRLWLDIGVAIALISCIRNYVITSIGKGVQEHFHPFCHFCPKVQRWPCF